MKKVFKMMAIAAIASLAFVACNNNKAAEEEVDSTAIEMVVEDEMIAEPAEVLDTTPVVEEQQAAPATKPAAKKAVKKAEQKTSEATKAESNVNDVKTATNQNQGPQTAPLKRTR